MVKDRPASAGTISLFELLLDRRELRVGDKFLNQKVEYHQV
jgi:hypothetical protein